MVNEFEIIKKALSMYNIEVQEEDLITPHDNGTEKHEITLCKMWLESAFQRVLKSFKWSFFTEPISLYSPYKVGGGATLQSDVSFPSVAAPSLFGFRNVFEVEDPLYTVVSVIARKDHRENVVYKFYNGKIYTNAREIEVFGIKKKSIAESLENEFVPIEFWDAVAYMLAELIAPSLAPKDMTIQQLIMSQYQMVLQTLLTTETTSGIKRISNEELEV